MKKYADLNCCTAVITFLVALFLFSGPARAYVYDDFTEPVINTSLWVDVGPNKGLFSLTGEGSLQFYDPSGGQSDRLRSVNSVSGAFFVSMEFSNFQADNQQGPNLGKSSAVTLRLGFGTTGVDMLAYKNVDGTGFQALSTINGGTPNEITTPLGFVSTPVTSGWLGISYDGISEVNFYYKIGDDWKWLTSCTENFGGAPFFSIRGFDLFGSSLIFQVKQVQIVPSIQVKIDLKPGSNPNCVNPESKGKTTVAIYGSDTFNVADIDQASLRFGGAPPLWCNVEDAIMEGPTLVFTQDGIPDLVCHFDTSQIAWPPAGSDCGIVKLTGTLNNGVSIQGSDTACLAGEPTCSSGTPIPVP